MRTSRRNNSFCKNDKGFSIVELIIVIAVLSIVMGMFMMGINMIFGLPARECARELKSAIEKTRIDTMGKKDSDAKLVITVEEDGVYAEETYEGLSPTEGGTSRKKKLCDRKVAVYWGSDELVASDSKTLYFKRDTGGFSEASDCNFVDTIKIASGSNSWKLTLHKLTGIVDLERE